MKRPIALIVALVVVLAACSSSAEEPTTTIGTRTPTVETSPPTPEPTSDWLRETVTLAFGQIHQASISCWDAPNALEVVRATGGITVPRKDGLVSIGVGFLINGYVVTAAHVIVQDDSPVEKIVYNYPTQIDTNNVGQPVFADFGNALLETVYVDEDMDIAVLKLKNPEEHTTLTQRSLVPASSQASAMPEVSCHFFGLGFALPKMWGGMLVAQEGNRLGFAAKYFYKGASGSPLLVFEAGALRVIGVVQRNEAFLEIEIEGEEYAMPGGAFSIATVCAHALEQSGIDLCHD